MSGKEIDPAKALLAAQLYEEHQSAPIVAGIMKVANSTAQRYIERGQKLTTEAKAKGINPILPEFPDEDVSINKIIDHMAERFTKRRESFKAHTWFPVKLPDNKPIGICWFGDPHLDDNGCNWPALRDDIKACKTTPGLYGANIGDSSNNWSGRLVRLYAEQDSSVKTARRLVKWFLVDSGVNWLVWLLGNHDVWGDGAEIIAAMVRAHHTHKIVCHDWEARFSLAFPNGWKPRIYAAHDFPGHSQWNPLHGPMKAGQMGDEAELFVCGHKHNAATFEFENAARGGVFQRFIRVRGYKFMDDHARRMGLSEQAKGCSSVSVFDPTAQRISVFADVAEGADFLKFARAKK